MAMNPDIAQIKKELWYASGNTIFTEGRAMVGNTISSSLAMFIVQTHNANIIAGYNPEYTHEQVAEYKDSVK